LADFNLVVGWSIRQTAKFSGYTVYTEVFLSYCAGGLTWKRSYHNEGAKIGIL
jgi:hypothetical protein